MRNRKFFKILLLLVFSLSINEMLWGDDSQIVKLQKELAQRYFANDPKKDIINYMNMNDKFQGKFYLLNKKIQVQPSSLLNSNAIYRFKYYFTNHIVADLLSYDIDMYDDIINSRHRTNEQIRKKSQKILDIGLGALALTKLVNNNVKDINRLKYVKKGVERGGSTALFINQMKYLIRKKVGEEFKKELNKKAKEVVSEKIPEGPFKRIAKACVMITKPKGSTALASCALETGGQLILNIGDIYTSFEDLKDIRKRNAALVAEYYLHIYNVMAASEQSEFKKMLEFYHSSLNIPENQLDTLKGRLDGLAKFMWNKKYLIGAKMEYNYDAAKDYIIKYQSIIEDLTKSFYSNYSSLILSEGDMGVRFYDIKKDSWIFEKLQLSKAYEIEIKGYYENGKYIFKPNSNISKKDALQIIYQEISPEDFNEDDIGINEDNKNEPLTRIEMAKILFHYIKFKIKQKRLDEIKKNVTNDWSYEALVLKKFKIVNGDSNGMFNPNNNISRAEFLAMLINGINFRYFNNVNASLSEVINLMGGN